MNGPTPQTMLPSVNTLKLVVDKPKYKDKYFFFYVHTQMTEEYQLGIQALVSESVHLTDDMVLAKCAANTSEPEQVYPLHVKQYPHAPTSLTGRYCGTDLILGMYLMTSGPVEGVCKLNNHIYKDHVYFTFTLHPGMNVFPQVINLLAYSYDEYIVELKDTSSPTSVEAYFVFGNLLETKRRVKCAEVSRRTPHSDQGAPLYNFQTSNAGTTVVF